ncbi:MAG: DUF3473 domain-containing protein [Pedobacter sp.]|nr:MAG: DUF3473 domain-containing protein [Pedobacter sp.]
MKQYSILSFDVEEFDITLEYDQSIPMDEQMEIGKRGLDALIPVWEKYQLPCTLYTTANYAQSFRSTMHALAQTHEIASHTFYHSSFETADLLSSRLALEAICGKKVNGLRMPRMKQVPVQDVLDAGYSYDSSIHPTWLPGRYNNFHLPRTAYREENLLRIPASVSPGIRLPLFWLAFKNYRYSLFLALCKQTLKKDGYLNLYFHPWEFTDISPYQLPGYVKKISGPALVERLERLVNDLSKISEFITTSQLIELKDQFKNVRHISPIHPGN